MAEIDDAHADDLSELAVGELEDEPEDDDRSFGTHIREAINAFRGRAQPAFLHTDGASGVPDKIRPE